MEKSIIIGSMFAVVLLILAMFPTVVGVQTSTSIKKTINLKIIDAKDSKGMQKLLLSGWYPGWLFDIILLILISILFSFSNPQ